MRSSHHGVPSDGGLVGEGAVAEAAHVGLLPRVDALVPLERVELGELLGAVLAAVGTLAWRGEKGDGGGEDEGLRAFRSSDVNRIKIDVPQYVVSLAMNYE